MSHVCAGSFQLFTKFQVTCMVIDYAKTLFESSSQRFTPPAYLKATKFITRLGYFQIMEGHSGRVGSLAWNTYVLSSGSRTGTIVHHDVRQREHIISTLNGHSQEVNPTINLYNTDFLNAIHPIKPHVLAQCMCFSWTSWFTYRVGLIRKMPNFTGGTKI